MRAASGLIALFLVGCFSPSYRDCEVSCATSNACPSGLSCVGGMCRVDGMTGACGESGGDGGGSGSGGDIPIEMYASAQIDALCGYMARCGAFEDIATCRKLIFPPSYRFFDNGIAAVAAGKAVYHGDKAKQCIDAYSTLACDRSLVFNGHFAEVACVQVFSGTLDKGAMCGTDEECTSQSCTKPANCPPGSCCQGSCAAGQAPGLRNVGDSCGTRDICNNGYCEGGLCVAYRAPGAACTGGNQCQLGYECAFSSNPAVCKKLSPTNGPCQNGFDCLEVADSCGGGTCKPGGLAGDACQPTTAGCQLDHYCSNQGVCSLPPTIGQSCANTGQCLDGYCNNQPGVAPVCAQRLADGAQCNANLGGNDCQSGLCDQTTLTCRTPQTCI